MTLQSSITAEKPLPDFSAFYAEVNQWRGRCIAHFTKAEFVIAENLISQLLHVGQKTKLPHLSGQRLQKLSDLIDDQKLLGKTGGRVLAALTAIAALQPMRNALCHGRSLVAVDDQGSWHCILETITDFGEKHVLHIDRVEAERLETIVKKCRNDVCATLARLQKTLSEISYSPAPPARR